MTRQCCAGLVLLIVGWSQSASALSNTTLRVLACDELPPWTSMQQSRGNITFLSGIEVDLVTQACRHLGIAFSLQSAQIADALRKFGAGEADMLICGSAIDSERLHLVDYSDPHTASGLHVARRSKTVRTHSVHRLLNLAFTSRALLFVAAAVLTVATAAVAVAIAEKVRGSIERHSLRANEASELSNLLQTLEWAMSTMLYPSALRLGPSLQSSFARALATIAGTVAHLLMIMATAAAVCTAVTDGKKVAVTLHQSELEKLHVGVVRAAHSTKLDSARSGQNGESTQSFTEFPTLTKLINALSDGQIDAAVAEAKSLQASIAAANIDADQLVFASIVPVLPLHMAFEFANGSRFRAPINRALHEMRQAGHLQTQQALHQPAVWPSRDLPPGLWTHPSLILCAVTCGLLLCSAWLRLRQQGELSEVDREPKERLADLGSVVDRDALMLLRGSLDGQENVGQRAHEAEAWNLVLTELRSEKDKLAQALGWTPRNPLPANVKYDFSNGFVGVSEEARGEPAASARLFAGTRSLAESTDTKNKPAIVTAQMALSPPNGNLSC